MNESINEAARALGNTGLTHEQFKEISNQAVSGFDEMRIAVYIGFGILTAVFAIIQIILTNKHKKDSYELERRKASNEAIRDYVSGKIGEKVDKLKRLLDDVGCRDYLWDHDKNIDIVFEIESNLTESDEDKMKAITIKSIRYLTYDLLNYYEYIANSVALDAMNETILHNFYAVIFIDFRRFSKPLIIEDSAGILPWTQFADLADKWESDFGMKRAELDESMNYAKKLQQQLWHKTLKKL